MMTFFKEYIFIKIMKILICKRCIKNKKIIGKIIATIIEKFCLYWKNKKKTLSLPSIICNKSKNHKVNYENI